LAEGSFTVVSLAGVADVLCRELEPAFAVLAGGRPALLVVELSGLRYADCWALSVMLGAGLGLREAGSRMALAGPQALVARSLQLMRTDPVFPVYRSVQEAAAR
jgi:anti-anti-sigma factor